MNLQRNDDINLDEGKQCTKITPVVTDASEGSLEESPSIPLIAGTVSKKKQASCCLIGLSLRRRLLFVLFWDIPQQNQMSALTFPFVVVKTSIIALRSMNEENIFPLTNNQVSTAGFYTSSNVITK